MTGQEELRQLVFQIQRLELEQRLEQMRESIIREKESRKQNAAYEQWITEQKRNLEVIKMEKVNHENFPVSETLGTTQYASIGGSYTISGDLLTWGRAKAVHVLLRAWLRDRTGGSCANVVVIGTKLWPPLPSNFQVMKC